MELFSLYNCADMLGVTVRRLRYFLDKDRAIPYRQIDLGGNTHVRYFTAADFQKMQAWWTERNPKKEEQNHG